MHQELVAIDRTCDDFSRDPDQLLLVFYQPQPDLLLGYFGITFYRFLFPLEFLIAQIPKGRDDRREKQQYGDKGPQRGETVLAGSRLPPPPAAVQALR